MFSGTIGVKTLAIVGSGSPAIFHHLPEVQVFQAGRGLMPCVGCYLLKSLGYRRACDFGCQALAILPGAGAAEIVAMMLGTQTRTHQDDAGRAMQLQDGPAVEREPCDAVAGQ